MADDLVPSPQHFGDRHREKIRALVEFRARAQAIADDASASPGDRLSRLRRLIEDAPGEPARLLAQGFQKDATVKRVRNWSELIGYCRFAAAPVGDFLIEVHEEDRTRARAAEALFIGKHILRRIQTCKVDYLTHDRVYLPGDWMRRAGVEAAALGGSRTIPELRPVFGQILDGVDDMIVVAQSGLAGLADRRLRIAMLTELAALRRLAATLRRADPLASTVTLSRSAYLCCVMAGRARGFWAPARSL